MTEARTVTVERTIPYPAEKIWRALTQPHLMEEWLMKNDFVSPTIGQKFSFKEEWGSIECEVVEVQPGRTLSYKWSAFGLDSVVTFTLEEGATGTLLRVEQEGFPMDQHQAYRGAQMAWPEYLAKLEQALSKLGDEE
jgi:uncharacterized protein YndB with AHSA1/START domain